MFIKEYYNTILLRDYMRGIIEMSTNKVHDRILDHILLKPTGLLSVDRIVLVGTMNLFNKKGRLIGQPDGIAFDEKGNVYIYPQGDKRRFTKHHGRFLDRKY